MLNKVLVANRGEIAVRVIRACRAMGIPTVAVYSTADAQSLPVYLADQSVCIGPPPAKDSYLDMRSILTTAIGMGADAIHPGYGFLSENATFAALCRDHGIKFIGPSPEVMTALGDKNRARKTMAEAGVPIVPGTEDVFHDAVTALAAAREIGWPIMVKAALGGGGKGMRVSHSEDDFVDMFSIAASESMHAFGDDSMYLERYIVGPRHIEIQVLADEYGNVITLGERDCSLQRNHQKMIEESPSPAVDDDLRARMSADAARAAKAAGYTSAGTIEFLLAEDGRYYFMEMNTRIQVEHPVTEMISGIDLVQAQIRIAGGEPLSITQDQVHLKGHAIECRVNAERPEMNFMPSPGVVSQMHLPGGNGVRVDTAAFDGTTISPYYDSLLAKIIVQGATRDEAIAKMRTAIEEMVVVGVSTNLDFQFTLLNNEAFRNGTVTTDFIERFIAGEC